MGRQQAERVFGNSLPKAGTHLLWKALEALGYRKYPPKKGGARALWAWNRVKRATGLGLVEQGGLNASWVNKNRRGATAGVTQLLEVEAPGEGEVVLDGVGPETQYRVPVDLVEELLGRVPPGHYLLGHAPFSPALVGALGRAGMPNVLILRDPRDVVVSGMFGIMRKSGHPYHAAMAAIPEEDRLLALIAPPGSSRDGMPWSGVRDKLLPMMPWLGREDVCVVRFETLVGPRGGGSREAQVAELERMASFLGIRRDPASLKAAADGLFDPSSPTFRAGRAGGWSQHFGEREKAAFKERAGDLLVRLGYEHDRSW